MKTHTGFTLIEVLIAMLVLAIGLLGMAALQTYTLRSNLAAYHRGQATQLLYDMSDKIRANIVINKIVTSSTQSCTPAGSKPCSYFILDTQTLTGTPGCSSYTGTTPASCTPEKIAGDDLVEWKESIARILPMGRGRITLENGVFVLYVTWDDDRSGTVTTDESRFSSNAGTFTTYVAPASGIYHDPVFKMSLQP